MIIKELGCRPNGGTYVKTSFSSLYVLVVPTSLKAPPLCSCGTSFHNSKVQPPYSLLSVYYFPDRQEERDLRDARAYLSAQYRNLLE